MITAPLSKSQMIVAQRVVRVALGYARSGVDESTGENHTFANVRYDAIHGVPPQWVANCTRGASIVGYDAGVLEKAQMGQNAWGFADWLAEQGLELQRPEIGCLITYAGPWYPVGHSEIIVAYDPANPDYATTVGFNTGNGQATGAGDGCWLNRRLIRGTTYRHAFCRLPGVHASKPQPAWPAWFSGNRVLFDRRLGTNNPRIGLQGKSAEVMQVEKVVGRNPRTGIFDADLAHRLATWQRGHGLAPDGGCTVPVALKIGNPA